LYERDPEQNLDGKESIYGEKELFTGKMNLKLKKRIMKCLVWSVALYAAETWKRKRSAGLIKLLMR